MKLTIGKVSVLYVIISFVWNGYVQIQEKINIARILKVSEHELQVGTIIFASALCILLLIGILVFSKKSKENPMILLCSVVIGFILSTIIGSITFHYIAL
jgi:predicted lysophospholipase L1 biosynthesis ABC-type transport system permease subunit